MAKAKSYAISKRVVWDAYMKVKANRGAAGVDGESLAAFELDLKNNLYIRISQMTPFTLACNLRQPFENKGI